MDPVTAEPKGRLLYLVAGWLFVGLAAAGVALPLLPTTPFVLLASSCFVRSSPRARRWLTESRLFGPSLRAWNERHAVSRRVKGLAVSSIFLVVVLAFVRDMSWMLRVPILVLVTVGLVVVWRLPVITDDDNDRKRLPGPPPAP